jgi:hypothetical protein
MFSSFLNQSRPEFDFEPFFPDEPWDAFRLQPLRDLAGEMWTATFLGRVLLSTLGLIESMISILAQLQT